MKSKFTSVLITLLLIVGCNDSTDRKEVLFNKYESAYSELNSNDKFKTKSDYFNIEIATNSLEDNTYRIDAIVDNPQIAMYNIQIIMEVNGTGIEQYEEIIPSLGIVDDTVYNFIPYQVNKDEGFYSGLVLSGLSTEKVGHVNVMISWSDYADTKQFKEYLELEYDVEKSDAEEKVDFVDENEDDE